MVKGQQTSNKNPKIVPITMPAIAPDSAVVAIHKQNEEGKNTHIIIYIGDEFYVVQLNATAACLRFLDLLLLFTNNLDH